LKRQSKIKKGIDYQRLTWEALKKSLNGIINKVSPLNIVNLIPELFQENLYRGRGLLCRFLMKSQAVSPQFTNVYAALVSVINTKFPEIGEMLLKRLVMQYKTAISRNQKAILLSSTRFIAHLTNQRIIDIVLPLQIILVLLGSPTDDGVEVAVKLVTECGERLSELPVPFNSIFDIFKSILHEGTIDKRVQYMIEHLFVVRKNNFSNNKAIITQLDLVEENDQITHDANLEDDYTEEELGNNLNIFHYDPEYEENEKKYDAMRREILGDSQESDDESSSAPEAETGEPNNQVLIEDKTDNAAKILKKNIYLTIMSSLDYEECAHKIIAKMGLQEGQEQDLCKMIIDCCAQEKSYRRFYGLLAQRFSVLQQPFKEYLEKLFVEYYDMIHVFDSNKLRNITKFFSHQLHSDSISWQVLHVIKVNEDDTNSSKRIFIMILFKELAEFLGVKRLSDRLQNKDMSIFFQGIFPKDNPVHTRFSINFFTTIGLGYITEPLRAFHEQTRKDMKNVDEMGKSSSEESSSSSDSSSS